MRKAPYTRERVLPHGQDTTEFVFLDEWLSPIDVPLLPIADRIRNHFNNVRIYADINLIEGWSASSDVRSDIWEKQVKPRGLPPLPADIKFNQQPLEIVLDFEDMPKPCRGSSLWENIETGIAEDNHATRNFLDSTFMYLRKPSRAHLEGLGKIFWRGFGYVDSPLVSEDLVLPELKDGKTDLIFWKCRFRDRDISALPGRLRFAQQSPGSDGRVTLYMVDSPVSGVPGSIWADGGGASGQPTVWHFVRSLPRGWCLPEYENKLLSGKDGEVPGLVLIGVSNGEKREPPGKLKGNDLLPGTAVGVAAPEVTVTSDTALFRRQASEMYLPDFSDQKGSVRAAVTSLDFVGDIQTGWINYMRAPERDWRDIERVIRDRDGEDLDW